MKNHHAARWAFAALLLMLGYLSYLVVKPFISYILFSAVLVMLFMPAYRWLLEKTDKPRLSSLLLVLALILLLIVPSIFVGMKLVRSAPAAYESLVRNVHVDPVENVIESFTGMDVSIDRYLRETSTRFRDYMVTNAAEFLSSVTEVLVGLFIMFFVMFYLFTQGGTLLERFREIVPLSKRHQDRLINEVHLVVRGVIEGQLVTGLIQGVFGGVLFWILGIPNPLFWGFVMVILSTIPFLGSFIVWLPVGIWLLLTGEVLKGLLLIGIGILVISQIDNVLRPYLVGRYAEIHPALVLVGVLGGLVAFGFIGFVLGPLILALLFAFLRFYKQDLA